MRIGFQRSAEDAKFRADRLYVREHAVRRHGIHIFTPWPNTVPVTFDVSIHIKKGFWFWQAVRDLASRCESVLESVDMLIYQDAPGDKKRAEYLFRVYYRDATRQLTKKEAAAVHQQFLGKLQALAVTVEQDGSK